MVGLEATSMPFFTAGVKGDIASCLPGPHEKSAAFLLLLRRAPHRTPGDLPGRRRRSLLGTSSREKSCREQPILGNWSPGSWAAGTDCSPLSCSLGGARGQRWGAVSGTSRSEKGHPEVPKSQALLLPGSRPTPKSQELAATQSSGPGAPAKADPGTGISQQERKAAPVHLQSWSHTMPLSSRRAGHRPLSPADLKQVEAQRWR